MSVITLSNNRVPANAAQGRLIGTLHAPSVSKPKYSLKVNPFGYFTLTPDGSLYVAWHGTASAGSYPISVQVQGTAGFKETDPFTIVISAVAPPPPPPIPKTITLTPATLSLVNTATVGTQLCTAVVTISDGSTFSGTLSSNDTLAAVSGLSIKLRRGLSATDVGAHNITITATQNGVSVSNVFALTINAVAPPPPPKPTSITLTPGSISLPDNSPTSTLLCNIAVAMSDGSAFSGSLISGDLLATISALSLRLSRGLATSDDGLHNIVVTASQNGVSVTTAFALTIVVAPPVGSATITVNGSSSAVVIADAQVTVAVTNGPGNIGDYVAFAHVGAPDSSYLGFAYVSGATSSVVMPAPHARGAYEARLYLNVGTTVLARCNFSVQGPPPGLTLPDSPLPLFSYGRHPSNVLPTIAANPSAEAGQVVSGTVQLINNYADTGPPSGPSNPGTITGQWMLGRPATKDVVPLGPYIIGDGVIDPYYQMAYDWDTTTVPDGTYVVYMRFIEWDIPTWPYSIYNNLQASGLSLIVANHGPPSIGAQTVAATLYALFGQYIPARPDFITYAGTPWPMQATHPSPSASTGFIAPLAGDVAGRDVANWWADEPGQPRLREYEMGTRWQTTPAGGVYVGTTTNESGTFIDEATYHVGEKRGTLDGGRLNATVDGYTSLVAAPDGLSWYSAELLGAIRKIEFDGSVKTVYGKRLNRSVLPYDPFNRKLTDDQVDSRLETIGDGALEVGGVNDMCFDPRDPDIFYFVNTLENFIGKVHESTGVGTVYAGIPGTSGFANGAAASATFNSPTSILMSDGTGNGGPIGTMYVADMLNNCIRIVSADGSTVSTLVGKQPLPDGVTIAANPPTYSPPGTVTGYANIYLPAPFSIRWTSARNITVGMQYFLAMREIDLAAHSSRLIGYYGNVAGTVAPPPAYIGPSPAVWFWHDCDYAGACGGVDDILMLVGIGQFPGGEASDPTLWRFSLDGTLSARM